MQPIKDFLIFLFLIPVNALWRWLESPQIKIEKDSIEKRQSELTIDNNQRRRITDIKNPLKGFSFTLPPDATSVEIQIVGHGGGGAGGKSYTDYHDETEWASSLCYKCGGTRLTVGAVIGALILNVMLAVDNETINRERQHFEVVALPHTPVD